MVRATTLYAARRLLQASILLGIVSLVAFSILYLTPGGPLSQFVAGGQMSSADVARIEHQLGLDEPLPIRYLTWLSRMLVGDWGRSYRDQQPVLAVIGSHLGATVELMITSNTIAMLLGCSLGVWVAIRRNSLMDETVTVASMMILSIPTFWLGLLVIYVFSIHLGWLPAGNRATPGSDALLDRLVHLIAPTLVLAVVSMPIWVRYTRSSVLDVLQQDYVRTARAKGISRSRILFKHVLRNAVLPVITIVGLQLPTLLAGALVTETVFTWPGMGRLFLDSINYRDYPMVLGILMFTAVLVLVGSLLADLALSLVDPRIRLG